MKNKLLVILLIIFIVILIFPTFALAQDQTDGAPRYVIQPGDSLGLIASEFDVSIADLIAFNNISDPDMISPGQTIRIPGLPGVSGTISSFTIGVGETPQGLIIKSFCNSNNVININHITTFSQLFVGSKLMIPILDKIPQINPVDFLAEDITFLEEATSEASNPWKLLIINKKESGIYFFSGDIIYNISTNKNEQFSQISNLVTTIDIAPLPMVQGRTEIVHIVTSQPLTITGRLNAQELHFFTDDGKNYFALQGINAMASPGLVRLHLNLTAGTKMVSSYDQNILLAPGTFEIDPPLKVDPKTIDPTVTQPENEFVNSITSLVTPIKYWGGLFMSPAYYQEYTSLFGNRRTYNDSPEISFHSGVDFGGGVSLPIVAPADGRVIFAGPLTVRGNATFIDHGHGIYSGFFHQNNINVAEGDFVTMGEKIGEVGNTGRINGADQFPGAGAHLHWELWVCGVQVNPLDWLSSIYP
ncbi:MAG: peptidoglycan DD-metalloendopeptidase family protein [Chloroflexi bacterium]|nr:peptidoglycan DD-metalloendopeptidase family protein [Chloroflexota bacterium]